MPGIRESYSPSITLVLSILISAALAGCGQPERATPASDCAPVVVTAAPASPPPAPSSPSGRAQPQAPDARADHIRSNYTKYEYRIPMRDGARLFTAVYVPNDASPGRRYPFLMTRTPYSVAPYGAARYRDRLHSEAMEREGFIFVFQDVRGKHMSEGEFVHMRPHIAAKRGKSDVDESTDTYDTIEWLLANIPHHNGRVGMWGISYPGFYASAGAIDSHPALAAVSPQAPIADWWRGDDMHRHGAFNLQLSFVFFNVAGRPRPEPTDEEKPWKPFPYGTPDTYQFFLDLGPLNEVDSKHFDGEVAFWRDLVAHPNYDEFWQSRNILPHLKNIKAAVLIVGGWYDTEDLYGPLNTYQSIERQNARIRNSLVMGPWKHGGWHRTTGEELGDADFGFKTSHTYQGHELAFFRHHLKGGPDPRLPEALVFETGANRWRSFASWPPKDARPATLYLHANGALSFEPPGATEPAFDEYLSDPSRPVPYTQEQTRGWSSAYMAEDQRFAARRPDVLVYQTAPLERDITIAGPLTAELFVSTTGSDADWVVKLIDVNPGKMPGWTEDSERAGMVDRGSQQTLVRGEPFRGRFRDGGDAPRAFVANEVTPVRFAINDVFHTFQRGHRIMIQIQSSWFPFIDRNPQTFVPNIFAARPEDFVKATHRVYRAGDTPSALEVLVLPSPDE